MVRVHIEGENVRLNAVESKQKGGAVLVSQIFIFEIIFEHIFEVHTPLNFKLIRIGLKKKRKKTTKQKTLVRLGFKFASSQIVNSFFISFEALPEYVLGYSTPSLSSTVETDHFSCQTQEASFFCTQRTSEFNTRRDGFR